MSEKITVVLADDHQLLTCGLKLVFDAWEEFEVVGIASDGQQAVELCNEKNPEVVLMDMRMPVLSGTAATRQIKERHPEIKVVALTSFEDGETVRNAMTAGCDGFLLKAIDPQQLRTAIHSILNGVSVLDEQALVHMKKQLEKPESCLLNDRECRILELICQGCTNKEIAEKLSLQPGTVKNIVSLLLNKTYCISRAELSRYAVENGIAGGK